MLVITGHSRVVGIARAHMVLH